MHGLQTQPLGTKVHLIYGTHLMHLVFSLRSDMTVYLNPLVLFLVVSFSFHFVIVSQFLSVSDTEVFVQYSSVWLKQRILHLHLHPHDS